MPRPARIAVAVAAAAALPTSVLAAPSDAAGPSARVVLRQVDATHDSAVTILRGRDAERRTDGVLNDIRRVTVSVVGDRLRVALSTRFDYGEDYRADLRITTAAGRVFHAGRYSNVNALPVTGNFFSRRGTRKAACHVRSVRNDGGLVIEVPLSCLGDPSRIRLGVETWGIVPYPEVNPTGEAISYDDAFRTGPSSTARAAQRRDRLYAGRGYGTMSAAFDLR